MKLGKITILMISVTLSLSSIAANKEEGKKLKLLLDKIEKKHPFQGLKSINVLESGTLGEEVQYDSNKNKIIKVTTVDSYSVADSVCTHSGVVEQKCVKDGKCNSPSIIELKSECSSLFSSFSDPVADTQCSNKSTYNEKYQICEPKYASDCTKPTYKLYKTERKCMHLKLKYKFAVKDAD